MGKIEKTVFISYRRKDISWALLVYHHLTAKGYDVFFDYTSIPSGDFEQIIIGNIKARAHFLVILTPSALDRCSKRGDWLRREIETAMQEKRNIVPLFFNGFNFGDSSVSKKLKGQLATFKNYNGLDVPPHFFDEAMERLCSQYLNVALDAVLHPISGKVQKAVIEQQVAANKALHDKDTVAEFAREKEERERREAEEKARKDALRKARQQEFSERTKNLFSGRRTLPFFIGGGVIIFIILGYILNNALVPFIPDPPTKTPVTLSLTSATSTEIPSTPLPTSTDFPTEIPPTPTAIFSVGDTIISEVDDMVMVYVPAGKFQMGGDADVALAECQKFDEDCTRDWFTDEEPIHTVYLDAFWIDQNEVTNEMFAKFVDSTEYETEAQKLGGSYDFINEFWHQVSEVDWQHPSGLGSDISDIMAHPVVHVSWSDASAYCEWVGRRLPTEAEWEKAASWDEKAQAQRIYPWGNDFDCRKGNFDDETQIDEFVVQGGKNCDGFLRTAPVGSFPSGASYYGALDMAGNVFEWAADWYDENYYAISPSSNPSGPDSGSEHVLRGGSWWLQYASHVRSIDRGWYIPISAKPNYGIGFRCAQDADTP